ncbi:MAG: hypothetical protein IPH66_12195 [Crocinitomicaceae bacterium]|nr:hypothetical protein [Crocinitomicaceae bacterium]
MSKSKFYLVLILLFSGFSAYNQVTEKEDKLKEIRLDSLDGWKKADSRH